MSDIRYLIEQGNDFSKSEISSISEQLFEVFYLDMDKMNKSFESRNQLLKKFIEILTAALYSDLLADKKKKVEIVKMINKLKIQQELLDLLNKDDYDESKEKLLKTSERFGKKAQSSI